MGEARRKRVASASAPEAKPTPPNVVQVETFHRQRSTGEAIASMLAATNERREAMGLKPFTRSFFLGAVVGPAGLQTILADLGQRQQAEQRIVTPAQHAAEGYRGRRT